MSVDQDWGGGDRPVGKCGKRGLRVLLAVGLVGWAVGRLVGVAVRGIR
jgi:hypothetical protein